MRANTRVVSTILPAATHFGGLAASGVPVQAVTAWALFGCYDWDTLMTREGAYESGAFCLRSGKPRPTALADYIRATTRRNGLERITALSSGAHGWWRRHDRLLYGSGMPCSTRSLTMDSSQKCRG